ncbi:MAG: beta-N-acetylhexosaminidase [Pseudomonadota bacterium]
MTNLSAAIFGISGTSLTPQEISFFSRVNPFGYILFARNCESPEQIKALVRKLKELFGRDNLPILIDQEGGRVARLKPPHFPVFPPAGSFAELAGKDLEAAKKATYLNARLIAYELYNLGITVNCAPLADLPVPGAHDIIGDRAFGKTTKQVIELADSFAQGLIDGGVIPILKHIPGHGRAFADSHLELPVVDAPIEILRQTDFVTFKALAHLPMAMTAHVLYTAIDPEKMATVSPRAISLIRNELGFDGLLMSDDLSMKAMQGDFTQRARDVLNAGCDVVLHCNGDMAEMLEVEKGLCELSGKSLERAKKSMVGAGRAKEFKVAEARQTVNNLLSV